MTFNGVVVKYRKGRKNSRFLQYAATCVAYCMYMLGNSIPTHTLERYNSARSYRLRSNIGFTLFGNFAKSEPIWMKSGALWVHCWGLVLAYFARDLRSSDSLRGSRNFVFPCPLNNARFHRFHVGQILRHLNTTTSIENYRNRVLKILP